MRSFSGHQALECKNSRHYIHVLDLPNVQTTVNNFANLNKKISERVKSKNKLNEILFVSTQQSLKKTTKDITLTAQTLDRRNVR